MKNSLQMDPDSVPVDSGCDSVPGIPVTVPAEFEFRSEFRRNGNYNLAGTSAKFPFPRNSRNHPDSVGFHPEYVGDCKELSRGGKAGHGVDWWWCAVKFNSWETGEKTRTEQYRTPIP